MSDHYFRSAYYRNTLLPKEDVIEDPGRKGECLVTCAVESYLRTKRMTGYIINNLLLELPGGRFSETDLILLSRFGLHVFEIKTRTGLITGGLNSKKWTQCSSSGIFEFQNPLLQNKTHIEHLAAFLSKETGIFSEDYFLDHSTNIVLIPSSARWKISIEKPPEAKYFFGTLEEYLSFEFPAILSDTEIDMIAPPLLAASSMSARAVTKKILSLKNRNRTPRIPS